MTKPLIPPFTLETAKEKVKRAEDLWNRKAPDEVALAYTPDSKWRNRGVFLQGREQIEAFLTQKWQKELNYKLRKELFTFSDDRIAVHFQYEYQDEAGQWYRAYGNEHWQFDEQGLMHTRDASINEIPIRTAERQIA